MESNMKNLGSMKKLLLALFAFFAAYPAFAQLSVNVPDVVSADEQFNLSFIYEGEDSPSDFKWENSGDFNIVWGPQKGQSTSIQIVNGKRTKSVQFTYTYVLMPKQTGKFTVPPATIKVKGKEYSSGAVEITVVSEGANAQQSAADDGGASASSDISSQDLFLRLTLDKTSVVVGEPVTATLKLYQRTNIAGFEDAKFPTFNGFYNQEIEAPTNIEFKRESLDDKVYNVALLRKYVLIPQQAGTLTIEPAELVCLINLKTVSSGRGMSIFDEFFDEYRTIRKRITTKPQNVRVSALPSGAPASFYGGVGDFDIKASLSKTDLTAHEAASLVVTITGRGNVALLEEPDVVFPPDFEVYDTKITESTNKATGGISGSKKYEFPFIPRSAGDFAIQPISYTYYDVNLGRYVTKQTQILPFSVAKGADMEQTASAATSSVSKTGVKTLNDDIRYINVKSHNLAPKGHFFFGSALFIVIVSAIVVLSVALWLIFRKLAARRADVAGTKTRKATKMARKRLKKAAEYLKQNIHSAFYEELHKALSGFVADKLNIAVADLTKDRIRVELSDAGVDPALIDSFMEIVDACEFARYSPDSGNEAMSVHYQNAENVISSIDSSMKNKKKGPSAAFVMLAFLTLLPFNALAADPYVDSLWNKANDEYAGGLWTEAVQTYRLVESLGLESAPLYCNMGNAYFKAKDYTSAILNYERALRIDPSYSDARYNLQIASELIQDRIDPVPEFILKTWTRDLNYALDADIWAILGVVFLALAAGFVLLFLLAPGKAARRTGFFSAIVALLLMVLSFSFAAWQKMDYMERDSAIVMVPVTSVKSSPSSETSTDLFILHEGTKVRIIDEVGDWRNIELADGRQGWILSEDMEVI